MIASASISSSYSGSTNPTTCMMVSTGLTITPTEAVRRTDLIGHLSGDLRLSGQMVSVPRSQWSGVDGHLAKADRPVTPDFVSIGSQTLRGRVDAKGALNTEREARL